MTAIATNLKTLRAIRNKFDPDTEQKKRFLVESVAEKFPRTAKALAAFHEDLLFIRAFPGDPATLRAAERALLQIEARVDALPKREAALLDDTGVAGSTTRHVQPYPVARWIASEAGAQADIDWSAYDDASRFDDVLRTILLPAERDAFDGGDISTREWVEVARPRGRNSNLSWLVEALDAAGGKAAPIDERWDASEPPIKWRLHDSPWSVTHNKLAGTPAVMRRSMRRPVEDAPNRIAEPLAAIKRLKPARARRVIDVARAALAPRCREVIAISYPNPEEVYWCDLGQGVALAIIAVAPTHRLTLETNTAYLLLSNGVPIGYGGVTPLYRQANTGINIFDPFRGGEAAYLWVEMLRAFATIYGVRRFVVNGYQFGEGNSEAIASGAYWFYYRLGFRPGDTERRELAEREAARLSKPKAAKSDRATLKALAQGDLIMELPGFDARDTIDESLLADVSAKATTKLAETGSSSRIDAVNAIASDLAVQLGVTSTLAWPAGEQRAFRALAPIISAASGIEDFSSDDRTAIVEMMRAKGRAAERDFALASQRCERFFRQLSRDRQSETR